MEQEIWRDIPRYLGIYQISNMGRFKSLDRVVSNQYGSFIKKEAILKSVSTIYEVVITCVNNVKKTESIHRLMAEAFIENPLNLPQINHIDGNKLNNKLENLEWVTRSQNQKHAYSIGLQTPIVGSKNVSSKAIAQYSLSGEFVKKYESIGIAAREVKTRVSSISNCLTGRLRSLNGYKWEYAK